MPGVRQWRVAAGAITVVAAGIATALAVAGAAAGGNDSTVTVDGSLHRVVTISGSSADDLVVLSSANGSAITIASDNVVNQRTDCSGGTGGPVFCNPHGETRRVIASLLAGDDSFDIASRFDDLEIKAGGSGGRDSLTGGSGPEALSGGGGGDELRGRGANDKLRGETGNDRIRGGAGNDRCRGGPGHDDVAGCE